MFGNLYLIYFVVEEDEEHFPQVISSFSSLLLFSRILLGYILFYIISSKPRAVIERTGTVLSQNQKQEKNAFSFRSFCDLHLR
jgi:hypothetical protein